MEQKRIDVGLRPTQIQVLAQYVKDFSFENPTPTLSLRPSPDKPEIDVNIALDAGKIEGQEDPDLYEVALTLKIRSNRAGKTLFILELTQAALVSLSGAPESGIRRILYVDVPHLLFPFARQKVADTVQSGGFPPLLLNPVDFSAMYHDAAKRQAGSA